MDTRKMAAGAATVLALFAQQTTSAAADPVSADGIADGLRAQGAALERAATRAERYCLVDPDACLAGQGLALVPSAQAGEELPGAEALNIRIGFEFDSAAIRADQEAVLAAMCDGIAAAGIARVQVIGHSDATGNAAYNLHLSVLRAEEVVRELRATCPGVAETELQALGLGDEQLLDATNPDGAINRRVELRAGG